MNILVISHYGIYRDFSSSFVHNQAKAYAKLGHRVRVIIPIAIGKSRSGRRIDTPIFKCTKDSIELYYVRFFSLSNVGNNFGFNIVSALITIKLLFAWLIKDFKPDIVHAHTLGLDSVIGSFVKQKLHCPLVVTTHGSDTSVPYTKGKKDLLKEYCDKADAVIGVSSILSKKLKDCGTHTKLYSILNGFEFENISRSVAKRPYLFIQVGNLIPQKKTDITIRAFAKLHNIYNESQLIIVGEGSERNRLQLLCNELGVRESVHFLGRIPNQSVLSLMASTRFFVMPSINEGFGIVYIEAMASGCITIGTEGEGISDLIISGKNGFLVAPDDTNTIIKIIEWCELNPDAATNIADNGQTSARGLTWKENAKKYIEIFQSLM